MEHKAGVFILPVGIVTPVDVNRLIREIQVLDEFLRQAAIRQPGSNMKLPRTSRLLDDLLNSNKLNVLLEVDRRRLEQFMVAVKNHAPVLHMSFSADPSPLFTQKLVTWLRQKIHPLALVQVGLQTNIGAGCILRTTNKEFDFSLRKHLEKQKQLLADQLVGGVA